MSEEWRSTAGRLGVVKGSPSLNPLNFRLFLPEGAMGGSENGGCRSMEAMPSSSATI